MTTKLSYFDDYTADERQMMKAKMIEKGQTWHEIDKRYGHPSTWKDDARQTRMFG